MIDARLLSRLSTTIAARRGADPAASYVAGLFDQGQIGRAHV